MTNLPPVARRTDPATSHEGQPRKSDRVTTMRRLLRMYKLADLTASEAAAGAGVDPWQASKRVSDLLRLGYLTTLTTPFDGTLVTRINTDTGRAQRVLSITRAGLKEIQ